MNSGSILFIGTHNSCRSQMAEAFVRRLSLPDITVASAGITPMPISPLTIQVMAEKGVDISLQNAKSIADLGKQNFELVISLCDAAMEVGSVFPGTPAIIHWNIVEPVNLQNRDTELVLHNLRKTADVIESMVTGLFTYGYYAAFVSQKKNTENMLESLTEGVVAHDMSRRIFLFSRGAERLTGYSQNEVLGHDCHELFRGPFCGDACASGKECVLDMNISRLPYMTTVKKTDGTFAEIEVLRLPLKNENGHVIGIVAVLNDKTRLRRHIEQQLQQTDEFHGIIGSDYKMQLIFDLIRDVSESDFSVVVFGESGTGKELVARAIHAESRRANRLFVPINCGALPEGTLESELFGHVRGSFTGAIRDKKGRFALADGGTIFLDEVSELPLTTQVKLLRVLQEGTFEPVGDEKQRKVDVRIICATNRDLKEMVAKGTFREDLYYRLAVVPLQLPALRERKNDIEIIASRFLSNVAEKLDRKQTRFAPETITLLSNYRWPGNVRQLQNVIQYALVKCKDDVIIPGHLPPEVTADAPQFVADTPEMDDGVKKVGRKPKLSRDVVVGALAKSGGNKAKAARMLGVGRATLYNFINENNIPSVD